jgi:hypothetical protein
VAISSTVAALEKPSFVGKLPGYSLMGKSDGQDVWRSESRFELPIYLCPELSDMSNMIAPVSLDFPGTGSMCGIGKGVDADGRAVSRGNN